MTAKKEAEKWLIDYASEKQGDICLSNLTSSCQLLCKRLTFLIPIWTWSYSRKGLLHTLYWQQETRFFFLILEHTFLYLKLLKGGTVRLWPKETLLEQQQQPWGYSWSCMAKPEHNSSACILHTPVWLSEAGDPILQPSILIWSMKVQAPTTASLNRQYWILI